jgi:hypothetical protein
MAKILILLTLLPIVVFARQNNYEHLKKHDVPYIPWFTGPLLSPTPVNMKPGHPAIEPSITTLYNYGQYSSNWSVKSEPKTWSINPFVDFQFGFTDRIGMEIIASMISNFKEGQSATRLQDTTVLLGFQIASDRKDSWTPNIRIDLQEVFPTGSYQKLNPNKLGVDATGEGAFQTGLLLITQKMFYPGNNFLALKFSIGYLFPTSVYIEGFNSYGGGFGAKGKVRPGQTLTSFFTGEYSMTQNWGLGFDFMFTHKKKSTFSGNPGKTSLGTKASVGLPSSTQISLAPFVEYNFAPNMGIFGGPWFTIAGRNSSAFFAAYFAFLYTF